MADSPSPREAATASSSSPQARYPTNDAEYEQIFAFYTAPKQPIEGREGLTINVAAPLPQTGIVNLRSTGHSHWNQDQQGVGQAQPTRTVSPGQPSLLEPALSTTNESTPAHPAQAKPTQQAGLDLDTLTQDHLDWVARPGSVSGPVQAAPRQSALSVELKGQDFLSGSGSSDDQSQSSSVASSRKTYQWENDGIPGYDALDTDDQEQLLKNLKDEHARSNEFYAKALMAITVVPVVFFGFHLLTSPTIMDICCLASVVISYATLPVVTTAQPGVLYPGDTKLKLQRINLLCGGIIVIVAYLRSWFGFDDSPPGFIFWDGHCTEYFALLPIVVSAIGYAGGKIMEGINFEDLESKKYRHKTV